MIITFNGTQINVEKVLTFSVDGNNLVMHTPHDEQVINFDTNSKEIMNTVAEYARLCCENNFENINLDKIRHWLFNQETRASV
ncbi:hypothetical protein [Piscirickettsia litoralis]|uniref:Uncharacterized protein n=1 Tax=Piscirickettsia litoralis TaxID=1891921 RepID=A0ABX2ZZY2_9GAMM|nr:hypothetical protein [Piscirickettsia litoralis]ODN42073.1 hypothetical protein BGC07_02775 [Piscirickettsia litoralis]